jgi:16S rRNA processing protein RimM
LKPDKTPQPIVVGRISDAYGIKGWVKIYSHTQPLDNILSYIPWLVKTEQKWQPIKLETGRRQGKWIVAQLAGCNDRDGALKLRGVDIAILPKQRVLLDDNEFYWSDLIGLSVRNCEGIEFGLVASMIETGANDVLVLKGDRERLVPFLRPQVVKMIDLDKGQILVEWPADF